MFYNKNWQTFALVELQQFTGQFNLLTSICFIIVDKLSLIIQQSSTLAWISNYQKSFKYFQLQVLLFEIMFQISVWGKRVCILIVDKLSFIMQQSLTLAWIPNCQKSFKAFQLQVLMFEIMFILLKWTILNE